jgi:HAD superfamily hydrolase (TIGR01509 family)
MPASPIRTIIFDIGRVLIRLNISRAQAGLARGLALSPEELWSAIERDPRWQDWQEGRMSPQDWHINLCSRFGVLLNFEDFTTVWNEVLEPQPIHASPVFEDLSKRYKLGLLSNTDPIHVARMESNYDFFRYFPPPNRTYSCAVGATKPSPMIFKAALRACKSRAEESVYIDDIPAYADAARNLGFQAVVFHNAEKLRHDLAALGVQFQDQLSA